MTSHLTGLRASLHTGGALTSVLLTIPEPAVANILGYSGADYVVIDAEHGAFTIDSLRICVEALATTPAWTVIRVAGHDDVLIKQALDLGVDGVQIPTVNTVAEAQTAVQASRYPPLGHRGVGFGRASGYGRTLSEYVGQANGSVAVIMMIESGEGVNNAADIAAVAGVDALVVGPADLAADLGIAVGDSRMADAYRRVIAAGRSADIKVGVGGPIADAGLWAHAGASLFLSFVDGPGLHAAAQASVATVNHALTELPAAESSAAESFAAEQDAV